MDKEKEMKFAIYNKYYEGEITSEDRDALLKGVRQYLESNAMDRYTDKALSDRKSGLHEIKSTIKHEVLNHKYKNKKEIGKCRFYYLFFYIVMAYFVGHYLSKELSGLDRSLLR